MGFGLSIVLHLFFLFILSLIIALFSLIITYFVSSREKKKRKLFLSAFIPFHILFSFYFFGFIGSMFVSESKKVDTGLGDSWYAPINDSYQILMIDLTDEAYVEYQGETILSEVTDIQQIKNYLFCKTQDEKFYSLNLNNKKIIEYQNQKDFKKDIEIKKVNLIKVEDFYEKRKQEVSGLEMKIVGILSVLMSILTAIIIYRVTLKGIKRR